MATKTVTYATVGPFSYDDALYHAVKTDGQIFVGQAPTLPEHALRLTDLVTLLGSALPLSVDTASVVGTASKASREDHVHTNANILGAALPLAVATAAVVGTSALLSRQDHVHVGADLASVQTITGRKTFQTDLVSPLLIGGIGVASTLTLKSTEGVGTADAIIFVVGNNGATEAMRIITNGNVGIGVVNPLATLHLDASGGSSLRLARSSVNATSLQFDFDTTNAYISTQGGAIPILFRINTVEAWRITGGSILQANGAQTLQTSTGTLTIATGAGNGNISLMPNGTGRVGIGVASPNANAIVDITSTTMAFMPPRMTTVQRDNIASPTAGMSVYNTTTNKLNVYTTVWEAVTSA